MTILNENVLHLQIWWKSIITSVYYFPKKDNSCFILGQNSSKMASTGIIICPGVYNSKWCVSIYFRSWTIFILFKCFVNNALQMTNLYSLTNIREVKKKCSVLWTEHTSTYVIRFVCTLFALLFHDRSYGFKTVQYLENIQFKIGFGLFQVVVWYSTVGDCNTR